MDGLTDWLTTPEVARRLGVSPGRVRQLVANGLLVAEKRGRDRLVSCAEVERYAQTRRPPGRPETTGAGKRRRDRQRQ